MDLKRLLGALDVLGCVALYMVVGPALILVNKQLMTSYGFPYPMLISGIGQVSSAIGSFFVVKVFKWQPLSDQARSISWDFYRKNMVVVGAAFAAGVEAPSRNVALSVAAMSAGTVISSFGEAHFNLTGFLIMCAAETSEATRLVLTQRLLCNLKFGAFEGLYLMAPICAAWMWGLALFLEVPKLRASGDFAKITENGDRTSSVMVKLLGTARNAGLVLLSALALGEEVTAQQALGYGICLAFFAAYNYFKLTEKKERRSRRARRCRAASAAPRRRRRRS
ncbi:hypothetical protein JL720_14327 [Aureococcus anophagefferens]|nr:hypothetical protein JL720_14327 [Aureococcus anophagefferens]